jgi:hypothetical protein
MTDTPMNYLGLPNGEKCAAALLRGKNDWLSGSNVPSAATLSPTPVKSTNSVYGIVETSQYPAATDSKRAHNLKIISPLLSKAKSALDSRLTNTH